MKTTLFLFLLFSYPVCWSQTEQKSMLVGGNLDIGYSFQDSVRIFNINLQPQVGIFVVKNLLIGASLGIGITSDNRGRNKGNRLFLNTSFSPYARYYFLKEKMRPFLYAFGGYVGTTTLIRGNSNNRDGVTYGGGIGFDYFVSKRVAVEATLGYRGTKYSERSLNSRIAFGVGLQYFFMPKFFKNIPVDKL